MRLAKTFYKKRGYIASLLHEVEIRLKKTSNNIFFGFLNTPNVGC